MFTSSAKENQHSIHPLYRSLFIHPGEIYSEQNQSQTFRQFVNLQTFNFIKIDFKEPLDTSAIKELDAYILLQPSKRMSVSAEIMGIFREGFGANGQISFTRKNAFGNAEILNFSISGGFENLKQIDDDDFKIGSNIGPRLSLTFSAFISHAKNHQQHSKKRLPLKLPCRVISIINSAHNLLVILPISLSTTSGMKGNIKNMKSAFPT